ncbi:hypothetical protein MUK42_30563 [Musa troglodytarum]|uniref:Uncharacterized protein n=1 Tax=Musa troglodytarum TaxID=320322 RepID=A0A9E7L828_9LILI|nr:hypothetical protein MUK42_30563 [Musa troglodytarum]
MVNPQAIHIDSVGLHRRRRENSSSKVAKPALKLASLNNAKTTAAALRDLTGHGRSVRQRVAPHSRKWWQTAPGGGSRMRSRRPGSATRRCRFGDLGTLVLVFPSLVLFLFTWWLGFQLRMDVSVSLAKLEEAYKPEKQTKAAIWQAVSFILFQVVIRKSGGIALKHAVRDVIMEVGFRCHTTSAHMVEALALWHC